MSWDYQRSKDRIQKHLGGMGEITVEKLVREADVHELLSETCCRKIYGAHVYMPVTNLAHLASEGLYAQDDYKRLIRAVHIYQREVARIIEDRQIFDSVQVHFQGSKLHALLYRPINDGGTLAARSVLLQLVLRDFVSSVFNPAFPPYEPFTIAGGADLGTVIGTRNGTRGDRELLFLGHPANHAAKIVSSASRLRLTADLYSALPADLRDICTLVDGQGDVYQVDRIGQRRLDELLDAYSIVWDRDASAERVADDKERFPLKDIAYSSADLKIELDDLSIYNNKRVLGASLFADVAGFTAYIDATEADDEQREALRVFHAIRKEMAAVIKSDFDGVRVQYQGDRVQGLFHLPKDDDAAIATTAIEAAIGLQSSMAHTLKECMPEACTLKLAVGVDMGTTLVSKLGARGQRDRICLGDPVECAAAHEERIAGGQIGVSKVIYDPLPERLRRHFSYDSSARCYVATDLTADKVERTAKATSAYSTAGSVYVRPDAGGVVVSGKEAPGARAVPPSRPYAP
jgi:class 3 adenylate cyclase